MGNGCNANQMGDDNDIPKMVCKSGCCEEFLGESLIRMANTKHQIGVRARNNLLLSDPFVGPITKPLLTVSFNLPENLAARRKTRTAIAGQCSAYWGTTSV